MKTKHSLLNRLAACGVALAMASSLSAQTPIQGAGKVVRINGRAHYTTDGGVTFVMLHVGDLIKPGAIIQTSKEEGAYVDIVLGGEELSETMGLPPTILTPADYNPAVPPIGMGYHPASASQNVVRVFANTALSIKALSSMDTGAGTVTNTELDLKAGHIFGTVKKLSAGSRYEITMPSGVAGIRGSTYNAIAPGTLQMASGSGVFAYKSPKTGEISTQVVGAGQSFDASTGILTSLSAEALSFLDDLARSMSFFFNGGFFSSISPDNSRYHHVTEHKPHPPHPPHP
jgi:hypothetical protein